MRKFTAIIASAAFVSMIATSAILAADPADSTKKAVPAAADSTKKVVPAAVDTTKKAVPAVAKDKAATTKPAATKGAKMEKQDTVTTPSGLKYIDLKVGNGAMPQKGQDISCHYTIWLADGKKIQSSKDSGTPFGFKYGAPGLIAGWNEGMSTMKVGGIRKLLVPYKLAWGESGGNGIPPKADVVFEIELLSVK